MSRHRTLVGWCQTGFRSVTGLRAGARRAAARFRLARRPGAWLLVIRPAMSPHRVTFIAGDGTGPELAQASRGVLEATGVEFDWDFQDAGVDVYESEGNPLPDRTLDSIRERGIAIKGPTTTPV